MNFLRTLLADLRERQILPAVVLLAVLAIAIPIGASIALSKVTVAPVPPASNLGIKPPKGAPSPASELNVLNPATVKPVNRTGTENDPFEQTASSSSSSTPSTSSSSSSRPSSGSSPSTSKPSSTSSSGKPSSSSSTSTSSGQHTTTTQTHTMQAQTHTRTTQTHRTQTHRTSAPTHTTTTQTHTMQAQTHTRTTQTHASASHTQSSQAQTHTTTTHTQTHTTKAQTHTTTTQTHTSASHTQQSHQTSSKTNGSAPSASVPRFGPAQLKATQAYATTLDTRDAQGKHVLTNVVRLAPLPAAQSPEIIFLGVLKGGRKAVFLFTNTVAVSASSSIAKSCLPSAADCQIIELSPGQGMRLAPTSNSALIATFTFTVGAIGASNFAGATAATTARDATSPAGEALLPLLSSTELSAFHYDDTVGALIYQASQGATGATGITGPSGASQATGVSGVSPNGVDLGASGATGVTAASTTGEAGPANAQFVLEPAG